MTRRLNVERGSTLIELIVGLGIAVIVIMGVASLMTEMTVVNSRHQMEGLLNQTYIQGLQVAQNAALFSDRNPKASAQIGLDNPELKKCLSYNPQFNAGGAFDCRTLDTAATKPAGLPVPAAINDSLNTSFGFHGPCAETDPSCMIRRTTSYFWVCPAAEYCTGMRLVVAATPLADQKVARNIATNTQGAGLNAFKERKGTVFLAGRQLVSKGEISFTCASGAAPDYALYRLDYVKLSDRNGCAGYDPGPDCAGPMYGYGQGAGNCVPRQAQGCADGFAQAGLFNAQDIGINGCGG